MRVREVGSGCDGVYCEKGRDMDVSPLPFPLASPYQELSRESLAAAQKRCRALYHLTRSTPCLPKGICTSTTTLRRTYLRFRGDDVAKCWCVLLVRGRNKEGG